MVEDYKNKKNSIKEFLKDCKEHPELAIFFFIIGGSIIFVIYNYLVIPSMTEKGQANIGQQVIQTIPATPKEDSQVCESGIFEEKLDSWQINYYDPVDKDGFYCPRSSTKFLYRNIWYKNSIPTNFKSLELNYQLKNKDGDTEEPPSFIFAIGENPEILRFYVPHSTYQLVGFEKVAKEDAGFSMKWEEAEPLDDPVEYGAEAELKVTITIVEGNKVIFSFNSKYVSALTGKSIENGFPYEVNLPKPSLESDLSRIKIGFGTFIGNCVKPISYKFCY